MAIVVPGQQLTFRHPSAVLSRMIDEIPPDDPLCDDLTSELYALSQSSVEIPVNRCKPVWKKGAEILLKYFLTDRGLADWQQKLVDIWMGYDDLCSSRYQISEQQQ